MSADDEGFLYPVVDSKICTSCKNCSLICPFQKEGSYKLELNPRFYMVRHKSAEVLKQSTSGGAFTAFSDSILEAGGVVYGVVFDENLRVIHARAETAKQRDKMRISKYVQSDLGDTYKQVKDDLNAGKTIFFTGTPCQTAGIRAMFMNNHNADKLILCDLICHSIPSPLVWEDYKTLLENEVGGKITHVQFRNKRYDWSRDNSNKGFTYQITGEETLREDDRFYQLFILENCIARPSCHRCQFTDIKRASDLTIADYWGIEKFAPSLYDSRGVSVVLINTLKGQKLLDKSIHSIFFEERPSHECISQQKRLSEPGTEPSSRAEFWKVYRENGLIAALKFVRLTSNI